MSIATEIGQNSKGSSYRVADDQLAVGSTFGGPKAATIIKATGAIDLVYSVDDGCVIFGPLTLRHFDEHTGMYLAPMGDGSFQIYPEHQDHVYSLVNKVHITESIFVLSTHATGVADVDPPGVYLRVKYTNTGDTTASISTYAFCDLRGGTEHDVISRYDAKLCAFVAWNKSAPQLARVFGCSLPSESHETSFDVGKAVSGISPGSLSNATEVYTDPLAITRHLFEIPAGETVELDYLLSFGAGETGAIAAYKRCPDGETAVYNTKAFYTEMLGRSVVMTPNSQVNSGVLWAKANMLRIMANSPTGWCFVNDPTRSNNSVGRDTAWFAYGGDYLHQEFTREALMAYVKNQKSNGMIVEYYDIRNGKTFDYDLNINDDTPLLILGLWHHYNATGDLDFLKTVYQCAVRAADYILSQRNNMGLVWCTATKTSDWGIVGWRNVIENYRLSGATTEVNCECYAALSTLSLMADELDNKEDAARMKEAAAQLKDAINTHLKNPNNGLYYLNIDVDGSPRSDVTSDLVFPVMFKVADDETSAKIISRLSENDFWTVAGLRTTPRTAPNYTPKGGWGLLGGVWLGVAFWFAFAAADYSPEFMDHALSASFRNFSMDPRRNNTVPGQFSEWLHGETLANEGMMLSPWDPPRYLWAAVEGAAGFDPSGREIRISPRMASDWKWMGVRNLIYRGQKLTWFVVRIPETTLYTNFELQSENAARQYEEDITHTLTVGTDSVCTIGFAGKDGLAIFAGNTSLQTANTSIRLSGHAGSTYSVRRFDSLLGRWRNTGPLSGEEMEKGIVVQIEHKGFVLLELVKES